MKTKEENQAIKDFLEPLTEALSKIMKFQYNDDIEWFDFHEQPEVVEFQLISGLNIKVNIYADSVDASFRDIASQFWNVYLHQN